MPYPENWELNKTKSAHTTHTLGMKQSWQPIIIGFKICEDEVYTVLWNYKGSDYLDLVPHENYCTGRWPKVIIGKY